MIACGNSVSLDQTFPTQGKTLPADGPDSTHLQVSRKAQAI